MNNYQITKEIRLHHPEDNWFYQFSDDGQNMVEVAVYHGQGIAEEKEEPSYFIPKDCLDQFIQILQEFK